VRSVRVCGHARRRAHALATRRMRERACWCARRSSSARSRRRTTRRSERARSRRF
jgi:hypothetical protein